MFPVELSQLSIFNNVSYKDKPSFHSCIDGMLFLTATALGKHRFKVASRRNDIKLESIGQITKNIYLRVLSGLIAVTVLLPLTFIAIVIKSCLMDTQKVKIKTACKTIFDLSITTYNSILKTFRDRCIEVLLRYCQNPIEMRNEKDFERQLSRLFRKLLLQIHPDKILLHMENKAVSQDSIQLLAKEKTQEAVEFISKVREIGKNLKLNASRADIENAFSVHSNRSTENVFTDLQDILVDYQRMNKETRERIEATREVIEETREMRKQVEEMNEKLSGIDWDKVRAWQNDM